MNTTPQHLSATTTSAAAVTTNTKLVIGRGGGRDVVGLYCPTNNVALIAPPLMAATVAVTDGGGNTMPLPNSAFPLQTTTAAMMPRFALLTTSGTGGVAAGSALVTAAGQPVVAIKSNTVGPVGTVTPFNVIVPGSAGGNLISTGDASAGALVGPGVSVMQSNAGVPIIIRNQQHKIVHPTGIQRVIAPAQLPALKQEVVKNILLNSNTPRTLLKTQMIPQQQLPAQPIIANNIKIMQQQKPMVALSSPIMAQHTSQQQEVHNINSELCTTTVGVEVGPASTPTPPPIVITTTSTIPKEQYSAVISSATPIVNISKDVVLSMTTPSVSNTLMPTKKSTNIRDQEIRKFYVASIERQESLLKQKSKQPDDLDNQISRANMRSKSLQEESRKVYIDDVTERRLSTASEGKITKITKQQMETIRLSALKEENKIQKHTTINLDEFDETEYLESSNDKSNELIIPEEVEEKADEVKELEDRIIKPTNELIIHKEQKANGKKELERKIIETTNVAQDNDENDELIIVEPEEENNDVALIIIEDDKIEQPAKVIDISKEANIKAEPLKMPYERTARPPTPTQDASSDDVTPSSSFDKSLLCDEKIITISTSSSSNSNSLQELTPPSSSLVQPLPLPPLTPLVPDPTAKISDVNSMSSVLNMLSNFNSLTWKERIGTARGTSLRFELNEFNLVQIHERCPPRYRTHTAYEKAIYERETLPKDSEESGEPLLYLCRRCCCHGPAVDFLAPEFCSLECLKRDTRKRNRDVSSLMRKRTLKVAVQGTAIQSNASASSSTTSVNTSVLRKPQQFRWSTYLTGKYGIIAAPIDLFLNPFPPGPNLFKVGMKLEAIDPANCALFCVCSIVEIQGYRLKLTIDGYDCMHDFWVNADSMDIFPPGYCQKTGRVIQPPRGIEPDKFNWFAYLGRTKARAAHRQLFTHLNSSSPSAARNPFRVGMQLEAEDLNDTGKLCVATVSDILDERVRVHFDGYASCYDYWVGINSPYIHPCGWHEGRAQLIAPPDLHQNFTWREYMRRKGSGFYPASSSLFGARAPIEFKPHMKLEVVDPRNPSLIRPATVIGRKGHRVKLHLDCWPTEYCFWLEDDSPDLHPIGWCDVTGHDLEAPPGYTSRQTAGITSGKLHCMPSCRGVGNAKRLYLNKHATRDCCPYAPENWRQKGITKPPRLIVDEILRPVMSSTQKTSTDTLLKQILRTSLPPGNIETHCIIKQEPTPKPLFQEAKWRTSGDLTEQQFYNVKSNKDIKPSPIKVVKAIKAITVVTQNGVAAAAPSSAMPVLPSTSSTTSTSVLPPSEDSLNICREFLCDYGPRLRQNYNIWQQNFSNFNFDAARIQQNPLFWSTAETCTFVQRTLECSQTAVSFAQADIDGVALLLLQQSDLTELLGLKLGPAVKLCSHILQLRQLAISKFGVKPLKAYSDERNTQK